MKQFSLTNLELANFSIHETTHLKALERGLRDAHAKAKGPLKQRVEAVLKRVKTEIIARTKAA